MQYFAQWDLAFVIKGFASPVFQDQAGAHFDQTEAKGVSLLGQWSCFSKGLSLTFAFFF